MQDLGVPVDSGSFAVGTVYMEYHTARSNQVSFVSTRGSFVIRRIVCWMRAYSTEQATSESPLSLYSGTDLRSFVAQTFVNGIDMGVSKPRVPLRRDGMIIQPAIAHICRHYGSIDSVPI